MPPRPPLAETPPSPSPSPRSTRLTPPSSLFLAPSLSPSSSIKVGLSLASPIAAVSPTTNTDSGGYFSFMRGALGSTLSSDRIGTGSSPIVVPRRRGSDSVSTTSSSSPPGAAGILAALSSGESPQKAKTTILQPPAYLATLSPQQSYRMSPDVKGSGGGAREHAATPSPPGSGGSSSFSTPATASLAPPSVSSVSVTSASPTPSPQVVRGGGKAPAAGPKISGSKSMPRLSTSVMRPVSVSFGTAGATTATASTATASTATASASISDATASPSSLPRAQSAKARLSDMLAQRPRTASGTSGVDRREGASSSRSGSRSPSISSSTAVHAHAPVPPAAAATTRAAEPVLTRSSVTTTQGAVEPTGSSSSNPSASSKSTMSVRRTDPTPVLSSVHHTAMSSERAQRATSPTSVSASYDSDARYSTAESATSTYRTPPDGSPRATTPTPATVRSSAPATAARRKKRSSTSIDDKAKTPVSAKNGTVERKAWAVPSTASDTERELELNDVDAAQSGPSTPTHVADDGTDAAEAEIKRLQKATNAPDADDHYPKHAYIPPYEPRRRVRPVPAPAATSVAAPGHSSSSSVSSPSSSFYSDDRAMTVSSGHPQRYAVTFVAALSSGTDALPFARRRVELELLWDTAPPPSYWDYVPGARYVPQWRLRAAGVDSGRDDSQRSFAVRAVRSLPVVGSVAAWL